MRRLAFALVVTLVPSCSPPPEPTARPAAAAPPVSQAIGFAGYGPAPFGSDEEALRQGFGLGLSAGQPTPGSSCRYLIFAPGGEGTPYALAFMVEDEKFARIDVASKEYVAPGGGRIGMPRERLATLYAGRFDEAPHKYVEGGAYFVVASPEGGPARLVFELDTDGQVTEWRIGLPPQVHYVEGCS